MNDGIQPPDANAFRAPTAAERRFLELVTAAYADLAAQLLRCEVASASSFGSLAIRTRDARPSHVRASRVPGPSLELDATTEGLARYVETSESGKATIETVLHTDDAGMLARVEVVVFGDAEILDAFGLFIAASLNDPPLLLAP